MKRRRAIDAQAVAGLVRQHGLRTVVRAGTYVASVALYIDAEGQAPTQPALATHWGSSTATVEREARAWRAVTDGADVVEVARAVLAAGVLDGGQPDEAAALAVLPFLTA